ncbi:solute carrier family 25 member 44-like [Amphiura filiformis]|uniref:solute carrier family 25 member 44-like n=1 Tax=Amphiura filiformis TaxID=82378 RepID=UPI003B21F868
MNDEKDRKNIRIIEWDDMDKRKFYAFGMVLSMTIRGMIYPTSLIKTRLQVQRQNAIYHGTWDAFKKITKYEGVRGLYKGFIINTFTIFSGQCYITTYELMHKGCGDLNNTAKSFIAGGCASFVAQSITVPIDIVSQHIMLEGQSLEERAGRRKVTLKDGLKIAKRIYHVDGWKGFYRGYWASLMTFMPNSALWWPIYHFYVERLASLLQGNLELSIPAIAIQAMAGPAAGATAATLTNPMDIVRTRLQVYGGNSILLTFSKLIEEEGAKGMTKGLTARLLNAMPSSLVIIVGYESLKRLSLRSELADSRQW